MLVSCVFITVRALLTPRRGHGCVQVIDVLHAWLQSIHHHVVVLVAVVLRDGRHDEYYLCPMEETNYI